MSYPTLTLNGRARPAHVAALALCLLGATACGDVDEAQSPGFEASDVAPPSDDSPGTWTPNTPQNPSSPGSWDNDPDAPGVPDAGPRPAVDPFAGIRDLFGGGDGGMNPPPAGENVWTLNADSAPECPDEPPPIPIIGGACLGIYFACGWTNQHGQVYSCICDWVHWLCI